MATKRNCNFHNLILNFANPRLDFHTHTRLSMRQKRIGNHWMPVQ